MGDEKISQLGVDLPFLVEQTSFLVKAVSSCFG